MMKFGKKETQGSGRDSLVMKSLGSRLAGKRLLRRGISPVGCDPRSSLPPFSRLLEKTGR